MLNLKYTSVVKRYVGLLMSSLCNKNKLVIFSNLLVTFNYPQIILKLKDMQLIILLEKYN